MDPLSVGAGVIAVVGATGQVIKGIRRLKTLQDAPRELDDLLAEISQFELVLQAIQKAYETPGSELERLLETARKIMVDFERLIEYKLTEAGTSNKVDRWQWTRSSKEVERLRGQLRDVKANLVALVGVNTSTTVHQVSQVISQVLSEHRQSRNQMNQILSAVTQLVQLLEKSPSTRAALTGSQGNFRQLTLETATQADDTMATVSERKQLHADQTGSKLHGQSRLHISRVQKVSICHLDCACKCHTRRQLGARRILSKYLGRGYIQTAGYSILGAQCDTDSCKARAAPCVSVQYVLPQWLAYRMLLIWLTSRPQCGPEFLLRVPRVTQRSRVAFDAMLCGDVKSLKLAIMNGDCTPYDVHEVLGHNLFTLAIYLGIWNVVICLLSYGDFCSPLSVDLLDDIIIWENLIVHEPPNIGQWPSDLQNALTTELFPLVDWERYVESNALTMLHQIVCRLSGNSLDSELRRSIHINQLDRNGRSALWYAVTHRNLVYVHRLLEAGADPNIGDPPILRAAHRMADSALTEVLLDYGATLSPSPNSSIGRGWLPWPDPEFGDNTDALAVDELLIRHGINLNHRAEWRGVEMTILMRLSTISRYYCTGVREPAARRLEQLIKFGADIEILATGGMTAIMYAARSNFAEAFSILSRAGARLDLKAVGGSTILHFAIVHTARLFVRGDVYRLCEAMRDADLTKLDVDAEDEDGHRAIDLLRITKGPNWEEYCESKDIWTSWSTWDPENELRDELEAISALEKLLHHIQAIQGIPEADQYPPLGEYLSRDAEEIAIPGGWPGY